MSDLSALGEWVRQRHLAGESVEQLLEACMGSGWDGETAIRAVEEALGRRLFPAAPTPSPNFRNRTTLDVGDREVHVLLSMPLPKLLVVGNMLSDEECEALIESARNRLAPTTVADVVTGAISHSNVRTSHGTFFRRSETALIERIERRLERFLAWPADWGEGLQVLRYGVGHEYKPHHDYFSYLARKLEAGETVKDASQRVATVLLYLNEPEEGGGTAFTDVNLEVAPRRGTAVFFAYDRPYPTTRTRHAGCPVLAGEKWVATKWVRDRRFEEAPVAETAGAGAAASGQASDNA